MTEGDQAETASKSSVRVAFFAGGDPLDIRFWSGTPYYALDALSRECDIVHVERKPYPKSWFRFARAILQLTKGRVDLRMVRPLDRVLNWGARRRLIRTNADVYVSVAASALASSLPGSLRQILVSDATSLAIVDYYQSTSHLLPWFRRQFVEMEAEAMRKAVRLAYPSHWASRSAISDFGIAPEKVALIPWGPNLHKRGSVRQRSIVGGPIRLLFVGHDWQRKGGNIALETLRILNERGLDFQLDVVGVSAVQAGDELPTNATFHGRLHKGIAEQAQLLEELFDCAHLLFLPTRAEALGMVFAEASAMGLPSIAYATGGASTVVRHGETGILLDPDAGAIEFADIIASLASDRNRYSSMSAAALKDSDERLDWSVWAREMRQLIDQVVAVDKAKAATP